MKELELHILNFCDKCWEFVGWSNNRQAGFHDQADHTADESASRRPPQRQCRVTGEGHHNLRESRKLHERV